VSLSFRAEDDPCGLKGLEPMSAPWTARPPNFLTAMQQESLHEVVQTIPSGGNDFKPIDFQWKSFVCAARLRLERPARLC
jgi:hypothetical protein